MPSPLTPFVPCVEIFFCCLQALPISQLLVFPPSQCFSSQPPQSCSCPPTQLRPLSFRTRLSFSVCWMPLYSLRLFPFFQSSFFYFCVFSGTLLFCSSPRGVSPTTTRFCSTYFTVLFSTPPYNGAFDPQRQFSYVSLRSSFPWHDTICRLFNRRFSYLPFHYFLPPFFCSAFNVSFPSPFAGLPPSNHISTHKCLGFVHRSSGPAFPLV